MTQPTDNEARRSASREEILRQAGVVLLGRVVGVWEVGPDGHLRTVTASVPGILDQQATAEVEAVLRRWRNGLTPGARCVGCRLDDRGHWCAAPVRRNAPAPPPDGLERRSRERLILELAGLCLGLIDLLAASTAN
jgi:hypothetical protein